MIRLIVSFAAILLSCPLVWSQRAFILDESRQLQTIRGFGASDAWSEDLILAADSSARNQLATWLFSRDFNQAGSCEGIGLSVWRFNLGAGSAEQGDSSLIGDPQRRTECFLQPDGRWDSTRQAGTRWLLSAAKQRGTETFILFSNSPPVSMTRNGRAFAETCGESNLDPARYDDFAGFLCRSLQQFERQGIQFEYVSPVNEPEWGWCQRDGQEGNPYTNRQIAGLVKVLNQKLVAGNIKTRIQVPESGLLVFATPGFAFKPGRQNQINAFFRKPGSSFIADQQQVAPLLCAHSYFTEWPLSVMRWVRKRISRSSERAGLEYWMTEYCILRKTKEIEGGGRDLGMHTALYVARIIHHDLVYGNAAAWCWWLGLSAADFKDGLVYINRDGSSLIDSKTLWAIGNFSRFIRPGAVRIDVTGPYDKDFLLSAYKNPEDTDFVLVVINRKDQEVRFRMKNLPAGTRQAWETSDSGSLRRVNAVGSGDWLSVAPESITTFCFSK